MTFDLWTSKTVPSWRLKPWLTDGWDKRTKRTEKDKYLRSVGRADRRSICMDPNPSPAVSERTKTAGRTDWVVCWLVSTPQGSSDRVCCCLLVIQINYPLPSCQLLDSFSLPGQTTKSKWLCTSLYLQQANNNNNNSHSVTSAQTWGRRRSWG